MGGLSVYTSEQHAGGTAALQLYLTCHSAAEARHEAWQLGLLALLRSQLSLQLSTCKEVLCLTYCQDQTRPDGGIPHTARYL